MINRRFEDLLEQLKKESKLRTQNNEELEEALSSDVPTLQELIKTRTTKRVEVGQEVEAGFQDEINQLSQRTATEKSFRIKSEENIF